MPAYSPFDQELKNLETKSLDALRNVTEGWYVEYKRELSNAADIAKSISAFANTYGGWVFYGVEEKSKEDAVAGTFPGIARADVDTALQRIRQAVATGMNPSAHFETKVIWGPCAITGLAADYAVIAVQIPQGTNAPHVHQRGQIYRRVADGSEPKPESDRFVLDQLFRRSDQLREDYRAFVERRPDFSKDEQKGPYLRLMLIADPWRDRDASIDIELSEMRALMGTNKPILSSIPFDSVHTTSRGFVARQLAGNDPFHLGLTWNLRPSLVSDILIPLKFQEARDLRQFCHSLRDYEHIERFAKILAKHNHENPRVVDLNMIFNVLCGVVETQNRLLKRAGWTHRYAAKAQLLNVWRVVPFLDIPAVLDDFEVHGIPVCLEENVTSFTGTGPDTFHLIDAFEGANTDIDQVIFDSISLFQLIAQAFGVPGWIDVDPERETSTDYSVELQKAGRRALAVQITMIEDHKRQRRTH